MPGPEKSDQELSHGLSMPTTFSSAVTVFGLLNEPPQESPIRVLLPTATLVVQSTQVIYSQG